jgi:two-component system, chemotaxis family, sensor kinase CheA
MILIADDHIDTAIFLKRAMERHGLSAEVAHDGQQVLDCLHRFTPDAIILDCMMPKHDGYSILRHMMANAAWKAVPVIMYSALFESDCERRAMQMGAKAFLVKGAVDVGSIVDTVRRFLV